MCTHSLFHSCQENYVARWTQIHGKHTVFFFFLRFSLRTPTLSLLISLPQPRRREVPFSLTSTASQGGMAPWFCLCASAVSPGDELLICGLSGQPTFFSTLLLPFFLPSLLSFCLFCPFCTIHGCTSSLGPRTYEHVHCSAPEKLERHSLSYSICPALSTPATLYFYPSLARTQRQWEKSWYIRTMQHRVDPKFFENAKRRICRRKGRAIPRHSGITKKENRKYLTNTRLRQKREIIPRTSHVKSHMKGF